MATVVPGFESLVNLISPIDLVDGPLNLPQMLRRDVVTSTTELALDGNALVVVRSRVSGIEGGSALWVSIVVVVMPISIAMIMPA